MSFAEHASLPRTRSLRRARTPRAWWVAVGTAIVVNLSIVVGLSQVSRLHSPAIAPPLAVRSLRQVDEPEPPPPPPETPRESRDELVEDTIPIALPSLDLPATTASDLTLPQIASLDDPLTLPLSVPPFVPLGPPGDGLDAPPTAGGGGPLAFDTPAQREGAFDLDRFYPRTARLRGITGSSRLRLTISAEGRITAVEVLDSTPPGVFEHAAERLARTLRYRPATAAGKPVASELETSIQWTIK